MVVFKMLQEKTVEKSPSVAELYIVHCSVFDVRFVRVGYKKIT